MEPTNATPQPRFVGLAPNLEKLQTKSLADVDWRNDPVGVATYVEEVGQAAAHRRAEAAYAKALLEEAEATAVLDLAKTEKSLAAAERRAAVDLEVMKSRDDYIEACRRRDLAEARYVAAQAACRVLGRDWGR